VSHRHGGNLRSDKKKKKKCNRRKKAGVPRRNVGGKGKGKKNQHPKLILGSWEWTPSKRRLLPLTPLEGNKGFHTIGKRGERLKDFFPPLTNRRPGSRQKNRTAEGRRPLHKGKRTPGWSMGEGGEKGQGKPAVSFYEITGTS